MSLPDFLRIVTRILEETGIPHMLTGSLAAAYYKVDRATRDIDILVHTTEAGVNDLVSRLAGAGLYVNRDAALEALETSGQFNAIDKDEGWKADFIFRRDRPFSVTEFERRQVGVSLGIEVSLASPEDVLLSKLEWSALGDSELQRRDVIDLLSRRRDTLDMRYIERWVDELGLRDAWEQILKRL